MYEFFNCANDSCANYVISNQPYFSYKKRTVLVTVSFKQGQIRYTLKKPISVKKGSIFGFYHPANTLSIKSKNNTISDYFVFSNLTVKIKYDECWKFYFKALIDQTYLFQSMSISSSFDNLASKSYGIFNVSTSFLYSDVKVYRQVYVTNCNLIKL